WKGGRHERREVSGSGASVPEGEARDRSRRSPRRRREAQDRGGEGGPRRAGPPGGGGVVEEAEDDGVQGDRVKKEEPINQRVEVRLTRAEKKRMEERAKRDGFSSLNEWIRVQLRVALR